MDLSRLALLAVLALGGCAAGKEAAVAATGADGGAADESEAPAIALTTQSAAIPRRPPDDAPLRVLVAGDLIPHRPALAAPAAVVTALQPLASLFAGADGVIANYEAATGELEKKPFRLAYAAPAAWIAALPGAGIKAISVANNHACDLDYDGVVATLEAASQAGVTALGGDMRSDPWAPRVVAERGGKRVCAVAWTTFINASGGCARTTRLAVASENAAGRARAAAAVQRARAVCDATIAVIHGGEEYAPQTPVVLRMARQAAEAGADAVVVHHPHVASPVVLHAARDGRNVPIFASVGNLVSNQGESWKLPMFPVLRDNRRLVCVNGWTRLGVLADLAFSFGEGGARLTWGYHLLWTENDHADDRAAVPRIATRLLDPDGDAALVSRLSDDRRGPTELFEDPCWSERPTATEGDRPTDPRCVTTLERSTPRERRRKRR
jgi:poly-gamma-glutamate synthesis protein (capsule biosynthesis protein)